MDKFNRLSVYGFDDFRLDRSKLMLYRGEREIPLPPKVIKTLVALVESHDEILPKEELIERVWDDSVVEESNLSQHLYLLRKTLGKKPDGRDYIETLRRRGYRFNGPVEMIRESIAAHGTVPRESFASSEYHVRKEGNVLRLLERAVPAVANETSKPIELPTAEPKRNAFPWIALVFVSVVIAGTALIGSRYMSAGSVITENKELIISRLTSTDYVHDAVISPDGRFLAFNEPVDETSRVWLQQLGNTRKVEILTGGRLGVANKSFSPDGKYLYFVGTDTTGASFLYRVTTLGGTPQRILSGFSSGVSFSPDGKEILFLRSGGGPKKNAVVIAPADGHGSEREVLSANEEYDPYVASWSRDGNLVAFAAFPSNNISLEGTLLRILDLRTGEIRLVSDESWSAVYRIEWLPDDSGFAMIATRTGEGLTAGRDQVYLVTYPDGKSTRLTTDGSRHEPSSLSIANDGSIVAVAFNRSSQIWSIDASGDSRTAIKLTSGVGEGRGGMAALPDGRVGYMAKADDGIGLWIMGPDGSDQKQLLPAAQNEQLAATPDGKYFVYCRGEKDRFNVFRVDTEGVENVQLTFDKNNDGYMSISPDGQWLAYDSSFSQDSKLVAAIKRIPMAGGEPMTLIDDGCRSPEYSPDGQYLACSDFLANRISIRSASNGSMIREFDAVRDSPLEPRWTPDGQSLVYLVQQNNVCNLWKQPINGGQPTPLTDFTSGKCYALTYSSDGRKIYLARGYELRDAIMIRNYK